MANDPYKILGIDRTATDEEVKKAYRELARKYHPDNYTNSPLADLAEEKMKEINEAYETIRKWRKEGSRENISGSRSYGYAEGNLHEIRSYIEANNFYEAEIRLNSMAPSERNAEWHFLKGVVFRARGWYFEASKFFEEAHRMDPSNEEYRAAAEEIRHFTASQGRVKKADACDLCCCLLELDCCCECCGGDLIPCC